MITFPERIRIGDATVVVAHIEVIEGFLDMDRPSGSPPQYGIEVHFVCPGNDPGRAWLTMPGARASLHHTRRNQLP